MIKIYDKIEVKSTDEVKPYWRNPRKNDRTVEALMKVIPVVGFNVPIYIDSEGVIIKGHARYRTAVKLGMTQIPCIVSTNSDEQNRLDRVADNKVSELAEWDIGDLRYELENIDFDLDSIGFDMPKDDFMDMTYGQEEFNEVTENDFAKATQRILQQQQSQNDEVINQFNNFDKPQEQVATSEERKFVKAKCPTCGEEIIVYL
jgi:site-specific DNA-methyltransferase (adenine-specific)